MRVGFDASLSTLKASNTFKIGTWTPVWVQLRGGTERFSGFMEVSVADDDGTPTAFRMPVEVGANTERAVHGLCPPRLARSPSSRSGCSIENGRRVGGASQDDGDAASSRVDHARTRRLILTMGRPQGVEIDRGPARLSDVAAREPVAIPVGQRS